MSLFRRRPKSLANVTPDLFVRTTDGGFVTMMGDNARRLGDAIEAVIQGRAAIVRAESITQSRNHWLWRRDDE